MLDQLTLRQSPAAGHHLTNLLFPTPSTVSCSSVPGSHALWRSIGGALQVGPGTNFTQNLLPSIAERMTCSAHSFLAFTPLAHGGAKRSQCTDSWRSVNSGQMSRRPITDFLADNPSLSDYWKKMMGAPRITHHASIFHCTLSSLRLALISCPFSMVGGNVLSSGCYLIFGLSIVPPLKFNVPTLDQLVSWSLRRSFPFLPDFLPGDGAVQERADSL